MLTTMNRLAGTDPIEHVVVLMLENRSFDQMLGAFQRLYPDLDGIDSDTDARSNFDPNGQAYFQIPNAARVVELDPHHDLASVLRQIGAAPAVPGRDPRRPVWQRAIRAIRNADPIGWLTDLWSARRRRAPIARALMAAQYTGNFVAEFVRSYPDSSPEQRQQVMSYFDIGELPALHELARNFTICDHWFSSLPGPTWANRFFLLTGTSLGTTWMPEHSTDFVNSELFDQETIFDRLTAIGRAWRVYFHDFPQSLALSRLWTQDSRRNYSVIDEFEVHASGPHDEFPDYTFIEPQYFGDDANDDHPPHDSSIAQALIARVYNAIRGNAELWARTLLVITYDEHGGFYDHVEPPATVCPDGHQAEYSFEQLGVRVPSLLVSPWVGAGVWSEQLDHTSVGKYLCDKWGVEPLGERMAQATSLGRAIRSGAGMRHDTPERIEWTTGLTGMGIVAVAGVPNENQVALLALADHLDPATQVPAEVPRGVYVAQAVSTGPEELRGKALRFVHSE